MAASSLSTPTLCTRRQNLMRDPIGYLGRAHARVENGAVDAVAPGDWFQAWFVLQPLEGGRVGVARRSVSEKALTDQLRSIAANDHRDVGERELRMILHAPGDAAIVTDFGGLHVRVRITRQYGWAGRECLDLVEMHRHGIERPGLAGVHRMVVSGRRDGDAAPDSDLAALRIGAHRSAGR